MLPAHIIDEIRKRELEKARAEESEQPRLECPVPPMLPMAPEDDEDKDRGVVIIDL